MNIKRIIRRIFRKPAVILVTLWAEHAFRDGMEAAERRHEKERVTIYLASDTFRPDHLVTYNKTQFKVEKRVYGMAARLLTMNTLRSGCYYHTADCFGMDGMNIEDIEIRRKAFIKERLRLAGLLEPLV